MTTEDLEKLRSNHCLHIARNGILVALKRLSDADLEINAAMHRLDGVMEGLKHLVKTMTPPVSGVIRSDSKGDGKFGASRGVKVHTGVDLTCLLGEGVFAPHSGTVSREVLPYENDNHFSGLEIVSPLFISHLLYVVPLDSKHDNIIGQEVEQGQLVGTAQDIQRRYGDKMDRHIHWKLMINPAMFLEV